MIALSLLGFLIPLLILVGIVALITVAVSRRRAGGGQPVDPNAPRDVFTYLLTTVALYISAAGVVLIIFGLADSWFPGFEEASEPSAEDARIGISMAVVAFPILLYLTKISRQRVRNGETSPDSRLRQAFIYLSFFVAAVVVLADLMTVIYDLLSGDLTVRFAIKAVGLLVVAGLVVAYYRQELDLRPEPPSPATMPEPEAAA